MIVSLPELPVPLVLEFPFPAWATRAAEAGANVFVAGSAVYGRPSPADAIESLRANGQLAFG